MDGLIAMLDQLIAEDDAKSAAAADEVSAALMRGDALEKDYDRQAKEQGTMNPVNDPAPGEFCQDERHGEPCPLPCDACEDECAPAVALVATDEGPVLIEEDAHLAKAAAESAAAADEQKMIAEFRMPEPVHYRSKGERYQLIFDGVCATCAHCGQKLTDSESIERGIGPVCSKKGYFEDPKESDELGALVALAEFPELAEYVTSVYKPQGARKMMNFLVKICSLNRRSPVHLACTDAIEALGYGTLASTLRESVAVIEIRERTADPSTYLVWVKKSEWSWGWTNGLRQLPGTYAAGRFTGEKGTIVPKRHKAALWDMMKQFYTGYCAKVPRKDGTGQTTIRIRDKSIAETRDSTPPAGHATSTSN